MAQWYQNLPNLILKVGMQIHTLQRISWCLGNFDVKLLSIKLCFRWNGLLTKSNEIGHGYQDQGAVVSILKAKHNLAF
jgi:hypothetical protein